MTSDRRADRIEAPVLLNLTHCHQDHPQEADRLVLPAGTELRRLAHDAAARALKRSDQPAQYDRLTATKKSQPV
jgi:hypothetical protein